MNDETPAGRDNAGEAETVHGSATNDGELKARNLLAARIAIPAHSMLNRLRILPSCWKVSVNIASADY
jgi:hypothetical protein